MCVCVCVYIYLIYVCIFHIYKFEGYVDLLMCLEPDVEKLTVLRQHVFLHHPAMSKGFVEVAPFLGVGDKLQFWVAESDPEDALLYIYI